MSAANDFVTPTNTQDVVAHIVQQRLNTMSMQGREKTGLYMVFRSVGLQE
jgi:hypothetical protein